MLVSAVGRYGSELPITRIGLIVPCLLVQQDRNNIAVNIRMLSVVGGLKLNNLHRSYSIHIKVEATTHTLVCYKSHS